MGLFDFLKKNTAEQEAKLQGGLEKTRSGLLSGLARTLVGKRTIDEDVLDELESVLIQSDVGVTTTVKIIGRVRARAARDKFLNTTELDRLLEEEITGLLTDNHCGSDKFDVPELSTNGKRTPYVIMVVGVNGVGKTTTIGKLAHQLIDSGHTVVLGAADTFRAAAVEQLRIWAGRVGATLVEKGMNADPAAVAFEAVAKGVELNADVVIVDTAGRLHNKVHLMNELSKIRRTMSKVIADAPHEVLLVLDASTGQNAIQQAAEFTKATQVTALALTKLDGTARGGVAIGISDEFKIPVRYIGVGEGIDDLQLFDARRFVKSLFGR